MSYGGQGKALGDPDKRQPITQRLCFPAFRKIAVQLRPQESKTAVVVDLMFPVSLMRSGALETFPVLSVSARVYRCIGFGLGRDGFRRCQ